MSTSRQSLQSATSCMENAVGTALEGAKKTARNINIIARNINILVITALTSTAAGACATFGSAPGESGQDGSTDSTSIINPDGSPLPVDGPSDGNIPDAQRPDVHSDADASGSDASPDATTLVDAADGGPDATPDVTPPVDAADGGAPDVKVFRNCAVIPGSSPSKIDLANNITTTNSMYGVFLDGQMPNPLGRLGGNFDLTWASPRQLPAQFVISTLSPGTITLLDSDNNPAPMPFYTVDKASARAASPNCTTELNTTACGEAIAKSFRCQKDPYRAEETGCAALPNINFALIGANTSTYTIPGVPGVDRGVVLVDVACP